MGREKKVAGSSGNGHGYEQLYSVITSMVIGDFDVDIRVPEKEDRLTPIWVGLRMIQSTLTDKLEELEKLHCEAKRTNSNLRKLNKELTASLEENRLLLKTLNEMVHVVMHDLNSPIRNLKSLMDLRKRSNPQSEREREEIDSLIAQCVSGLESTWLGLRDVIYRRDFGDKAEPVSFDAIWVEVVASLISDLNEINPVIHIDFSACNEIIYPKAELKSILQNFLSNSIKYRHADRRLTINIQTKIESGMCVLSFSDNGKGIDLPRNRDKLFKPGQRFDKSVEGTGMGLHLINLSVRSRGGYIDVESASGEGTTFRAHIRLKPL